MDRQQHLVGERGPERLLPIDGRADVTLPSGLRLRGLLPTLNTLARRGLLTSDLYAAVLRVDADEKWLTREPADPADAELKRRLWFALAAAFPRERWIDEGWAPWTLTPAEFEELVAEDDKDAILALVQRNATAEEVTAVSLYLLGLGPDPDSGEVPAETPSDWIGFRDEPGVDAPGSDSGSVGDDAQPDAGDPGRGHGVPGGRGAGDEAGVGRVPGAPGGDGPAEG